MSFTCELSGEPLAAAADEVVVTPSGHVCLKRLLLAKLAENGGTDPFETIQELPLSEDQLVTLTLSTHVAPPRTQATSLPNLLQNIQTEYDALVLELFDTRKALEDTRRELSQALYQNDAAVRVVARLSVERDTARQQLEQWQASAGTPAESTNVSSTKRAAAPVEEEDAGEAPTTKKRKLETPKGALKNDLPEGDLQDMVDTWSKLNPQRKPMLKAAAAAAPSADELAKYAETDDKAWHKSTCRSVGCIAVSGDLIVTAGKDKQIVVYNAAEKVVQHTYSDSTVATCVDVMDTVVVAGDGKGKISAYSVVDDGSSLGTFTAGHGLVAVQVHPTKRHVCAATTEGQILVLRMEENSTLVPLAEFQKEDSTDKYSCGSLHPDGLLYAGGTVSGEILMWDFKNKTLASSMKDGEGDPVVAIAFSNNGYHLAASYESGAVKFWDLRKQKVMATMNADKSLLESIDTISYDDSGKYVAFGGKSGVIVTTVKEWGTTANLSTKKPVAGVIWKSSTVVMCSSKERQVRFFGSA